MRERSIADGLDAGVRRQIRLSRLALWAERLARALWPAFALVCFVVAAALLGGFEALGPVLHRVALALAALSVIAALVWGLRRFRVPGTEEAARRLESGAPGHPLSALTDSLAGGEDAPTARAIWQAHRARAARAAEGLRAAAPDLRLAREDRWAVRIFGPALVVGAAVAAGGLWSDRIGTSLAPLPVEMAGGPGSAEVSVEAWAVPPAYTGRDTIYLDGSSGEPAAIPQDSALTIRVTGLTGGAPALSGEGLGGLGGFTDLGDGLFEARTAVTGSGRIVVETDGGTFGTLAFTMIPDAPPRIAADGRPGPSATRALQVPFTAGDDYGVAAAWAEIVLAEPGTRPMEVEPLEVALPLPISGDPREVADTAVRDLADHPWAGAEVLLTLKAEDGAGQVAAAEPMRLTLPGRVFTHPLARALVDQRRALVLDLDRADHVLDTVQSVTRWPEEVFGDNTGAYLGVRTAMRRLAPAVVEERIAGVAPMTAEFLWQAALSLEEGDARNALERLRQAQERLREALESGSQDEIAQAMEELRQAMNEYLRQLAQQGMQNPQAGQQQQQQQGQQLSQQDLQQMLDEMQRQAESGMRDQAQAMLDQLSRMLENLRPGQQQAGQSQGQQALQQLQDLIQRQRGLSDETFDELRRQQRGQQGEQQGQQQGQQGQRGQQQGQGQQGRQGQGQQGQQGQRPGGQASPGGQQSGRHGENGRLAAEQEALRQALEELRGQLGGGEGMRGASRALEGAEREMGEAREGLEGERTGDAVQDQMEALDQLNRGAEALAEALQQNGQGQQAAEGARTGRGQRGDDREADPFDRPSGAYGAIDGSGTDVPDRALIDRARELLEELRRRSADQTRPELELDYFERLLDQF